MVSLAEATLKIRAAGNGKVRSLPMAGQRIDDGDYQIDIMENDQWVTVVSGLKRSIAENLIAQALNRVICG